MEETRKEIKRKAKKSAIQSYIKLHRVDAIFLSIFESILKEKPDNCIAFLIQYLHEKYPIESFTIIDQLCALEDFRNADTHENVEKKYRTNINSMLVNDENTFDLEKLASTAFFISTMGDSASNSHQESEIFEVNNNSLNPTDEILLPGSNEKFDPVMIASDDESLTNPPDDSLATLHPSYHNKRRHGIISESINTSNLMNEMEHMKIHPKPAFVSQRLKSAMNHSILFKKLDLDQKDLLITAFIGPVIKNHGDVLYSEGDVGNLCYFLQEGEVELRPSRLSDTTEEKDSVKIYRSNSIFGEEALLYSSKRVASCYIRSIHAYIWALDRFTFKKLLVASEEHKMHLSVQQLKRLPIFMDWTEIELESLLPWITFRNYSDKELIYQLDSSLDQKNVNPSKRIMTSLSFFIVFKGEACIRTNPIASNDNENKIHLNQGESFYENCFVLDSIAEKLMKVAWTSKPLIQSNRNRTSLLFIQNENLPQNIKNKLTSIVRERNPTLFESLKKKGVMMNEWIDALDAAKIDHLFNELITREIHSVPTLPMKIISDEKVDEVMKSSRLSSRNTFQPDDGSQKDIIEFDTGIVEIDYEQAPNDEKENVNQPHHHYVQEGHEIIP